MRLTRIGSGYTSAAMLRTCEAVGCDTLTFGPLCLAHEPPVAPRRFPRGRPYRLIEREVTDDIRRIEQSWSHVRQAFSRLPSAS